MQIPVRYNHLPGNPDPSAVLRASLVYDSICRVLSNRSAPHPKGVLRSAPRWLQFGEDEWYLLPRMTQIEGVGPLLYWQ